MGVMGRSVGQFSLIVGSLLLVVVTLVGQTWSLFEQCKYPEVIFNPEFEVQKYGKPTAFVSSKSTGISPYSLVDPYRQSALYHEYLLIGPGIERSSSGLVEEEEDTEETAEEIKLVIYDVEGAHEWKNEVNLVQHNLGKEYNWALINATGMLPSLTVVNTTFEQTFAFHADTDDTISYHLSYPNLLRSQTPVPPLDVLVEFPAKTKTLLSLQTLVDFQTFGLLRWRLSPTAPVPFRDVKSNWEFARPNPFSSCETSADEGSEDSAADIAAELALNYRYLLCIYQKRFFRIENPCIKDMFLFYLIRAERTVPGVESSYISVPHLFIIIPMVYDVLAYQGWYDLTEVYCSRFDDHEECGEPLDVVLTNDHLLIHTDKGLYVSNSLNVSNANVSLPYSMKPLLKWTPVDPCANFVTFNCSEVGAPILARQAIRRQRLFYTPVCHLYQYPIYEDMVMLVIEHITVKPDMSEELDVISVLYAIKPYGDWRMLFHERHEYMMRDGRRIPIKELIGIFFNHHRRHFDISLLLNDEGKERTLRFVLPLPEGTPADYLGYVELHGLLGNGFLEYEFPETFFMTEVNVNPEPLDVFFLGNQLHIAEAGGAFVHLAIPVVYNHNKEESDFGRCSFNHPDRTFLCTEVSHSEIFVGRIGITYAPTGVDYRSLTEFKYTMLYNNWPFTYRQYITLLGHFTVGYSGKINFWYLYDHNELVKKQRSLNKIKEQTRCKDDENEDDDAVKCHVCKSLEEKEQKYSCKINSIKDEDNHPIFRMISFDPEKLPVRESRTHGPLVPFLIDGDKVLVFEAKMPSLGDYKPFYNYIHDINIGDKVVCASEDRKPARPAGGCPELSVIEKVPKCELYIRHLKPLLDANGDYLYLYGFHQAFYATIVKPFSMIPIPTAVVVVVPADTNNATVELHVGLRIHDLVDRRHNPHKNTNIFEGGRRYSFTYEHLGWTLYIPGEMSVLLTGFPEFEYCVNTTNAVHDFTRMTGYATKYYRQGRRVQVGPFKSFLINFATPNYCEYYERTLKVIQEYRCTPKDRTNIEFKERRAAAQKQREDVHNAHAKVISNINQVWTATYIPGGPGDDNRGIFQGLGAIGSSYGDYEDKHLKVRETDKDNTLLQLLEPPSPNVPNPPPKPKIAMESPTRNVTFHQFRCNRNIVWQLADGGCHLQLYLVKHPVLKQSGGRISLDKYDSISFTLKLRSLTPLGKSLTHRSLISVTNTNPDILTVDKRDIIGKDPQVVRITLTPTGVRHGVATISVRPLIVSPLCPFPEGSFTLIVQVQREEGRRLHVNYPIPICNSDSPNKRPWKVDLPSCVKHRELLKKSVIRRPNTKYGQIFYSELPFNYRPPSISGAEIPKTSNVYHVDPSKPNYKDWYGASKKTLLLNQCAGKATRAECTCSEYDEFYDDDTYTDCKRMVYTAQRNSKIDISVEYDRLMKDEDQHAEFFSAKGNWTVTVEEVNNRTEYTITSASTKYLQAVAREKLLVGESHYYDAQTLSVTLHGTGLFHFKVSLGNFESFGKVSGFFLLYCAENELNHVQLVVIMLLTISICMVLVFCGFLVVRARLASQLPYKTLDRNKIKFE